MNNYAFMLQHGNGIQIDKEIVAKYYKMAADLGNSNAMNNYNFLLAKGNDV